MTQLDAQSPEEQFTRRVALVGQNIGVNNLLFVALGIYLVIQTGTWQGYAILLLAAEAFIGGFVGAALAKRARVDLAGWVILITALIAPTFASLVITNLGYMAAAYILLLSYFSINFGMRKEVHRKATLITIASLAFPILAEVLRPEWRLSSQLVLTLTPIFAVVLEVYS